MPIAASIVRDELALAVVARIDVAPERRRATAPQRRQDRVLGRRQSGVQFSFETPDDIAQDEQGRHPRVRSAFGRQLGKVPDEVERALGGAHQLTLHVGVDRRGAEVAVTQEHL